MNKEQITASKKNCGTGRSSKLNLWINQSIPASARCVHPSSLHIFFPCYHIPVGSAGTEDYPAWDYTKNGVFSVKSAYHLNMLIRKGRASTVGPSLNLDEHSGWLTLSAAEVPGKAKIHVWRLIRDGLAVGQELARRRIKDGVNCVVCNWEESLLHRFWQYPHSLST
jgi:hypothetical protein